MSAAPVSAAAAPGAGTAMSAAAVSAAASDSAPLLAARGLAIGWRSQRRRDTEGAGPSAVGAVADAPAAARRHAAADHRPAAAALASGIDLELRAGDLAVIVGPNGAGKSTLLRTLVGLQDSLSGEIELCGTPIRRLSVEDRATRAATVFTDRFDSGYFSVFDIVAFGRYPYTDARNRLGPRDLAAVESAIASVGLAALSDRRFSELSDGERQKALIARAVAQDCPVLVLDEPTAFLDAPARVEVFHLARSLARSAGKAVVLSTHDIEHALRYADELWLMDRGHRFESGTPEALALSGAIGRAFDGAGFRFDPAVGAFRSTEEPEALSLMVVGPAGADRAWTERLAERLGFAIADSRGPEAAGLPRVVIESAPEGARWRFISGEIDAVYDDIGSLASALAKSSRGGTIA